MGRAFDDLKDGTLLEPFHLNIIYRELRRWRKAKAVPPMVLDGAESSDSPPTFRQGKSGGVNIFWCKGTFAAATGSWPTLTPETDTLDVYKDVDGTMTLVDSGATVRWFFKDASGADKLIPLGSNGDGTYDALTASCTAV